jgi:hypothetical protein
MSAGRRLAAGKDWAPKPTRSRVQRRGVLPWRRAIQRLLPGSPKGMRLE